MDGSGGRGVLDEVVDEVVWLILGYSSCWSYVTGGKKYQFPDMVSIMCEWRKYVLIK